jgi:YesN/AraC family two-component response regulator
LLRTTTLSLAEISYAVGYQSPNYFSEVFKTVEGITASAYRRSVPASNS